MWTRKFHSGVLSKGHGPFPVLLTHQINQTFLECWVLMIEAPEFHCRRHRSYSRGVCLPHIIQAHPYYMLISILYTIRSRATLPPVGGFLCPASHSPGNPRVYAWLQHIMLLLRVNGQSVFPDMFSRNSLPLPSPNTPEVFAKYSFLAFDNLGFRFLLPAKGVLGRLTDITSPSSKNSPYTGMMGWDLCLS